MRTPAKTIVVAWVVLWIVFDVRPLIKNSYLRQYASLVGRSQEDRRAIVYGRGLTEFLDYAKGLLPKGSTFKLVGLEGGSVDLVRAYYYLYPNTRSDLPQFILVYRDPHFGKAGYRRFAAMDEKNFILKLE
jgi:hypothetical protein